MIIAIIVCTLIAITNCQKWIPGIAKTQRSKRFIFVSFGGAFDDKCDQNNPLSNAHLSLDGVYDADAIVDIY